MTNSTEVREWARENGYPVGSKGRIPENIVSDYDAAHAPSGAPDYPDDQFDEAFADMPAPDMPEEEKPRKPPKASGRPRFTRKPAGKASKPQARKPRISTEQILGSAWRGLAKLAAPLPPLHRTLRVQAPIAGLLLEDAVKGTIADTFLQPLARAAEQGKVMQALIGPPVLVGAISVHLQQADARGTEPNPVFMSVATEGLRSSLMAWLDVAGPKFAEAVKREKEFEDKYGSSVDEFISFIFSRPPDPSDVSAVMAEEEAIKRAQGVL